MRTRRHRLSPLIAGLALAAGAASADEGMWTPDNFPSARVKERYGVDIDDAWLERVRLGTVRLAGCTASFVSPEGLLLTNHHCVASCLAQNSTRQASLLDTGFIARSRDEELECPTQIADVLDRLDNVTAQVHAATRGLAERDANERRRQTLTELEATCESASRTSANPLKCEAVTLYEGGQYWLYQYRRYADVRLVLAPEADIAAFGGDPDNFQFPRWCLDFSLLRAYVDGVPAATPQYLTIDFDGPAAGEPVFVSGHPGSTDRQLTVAELRALRDRTLPPALLRAAELRGRYIQFAAQSPENARITSDQLQGIENSIKVRRKQLDALLEDQLFDRKRAEQDNLRSKVAASSEMRASIGDPWADIERAEAAKTGLFMPYTFIENGAGFQGRLVTFARALVRGAEERPKPNGERFREYTDAALPRIEQQLGAAVPIYPEFEELRLVFGFERMREWLGPDHPMVRQLLAKESPEQLAKRLVTGSKLNDAAVRLALWKGGAAAVAASDDPLIQLARMIEPEARKIRKQFEDQVEAPLELASEKVAKARFAVLGTSVYPDATFTLRLNWGTVGAWVENGVPVDPVTKLSRVFERATGADPFKVPDTWMKVRDKLDMNTPFNLATNSDIVGGNSGSPLISAKGEVVGLMFDGNIHSISGSYWFDTEKNRGVAVHPAIMKEALSKVYGAKALLAELSK